jgi:hypothetical protein
MSQDNFKWSQRQLNGEYIKLLNINKLNAITMFHPLKLSGTIRIPIIGQPHGMLINIDKMLLYINKKDEHFCVSI